MVDVLRAAGVLRQGVPDTAARYLHRALARTAPTKRSARNCCSSSAAPKRVPSTPDAPADFAEAYALCTDPRHAPIRPRSTLSPFTWRAIQATRWLG